MLPPERLGHGAVEPAQRSPPAPLTDRRDLISLPHPHRCRNIVADAVHCCYHATIAAAAREIGGHRMSQMVFNGGETLLGHVGNDGAIDDKACSGIVAERDPKNNHPFFSRRIMQCISLPAALWSNWMLLFHACNRISTTSHKRPLLVQCS